MPIVLHQDRRISYSKVGAGSPVVFVHGSFAASSAWRKIVANLDAQRCCALAIDLPGSGDSDAIRGDPLHDVAMEAEAIEAVIANESDIPVQLVAHSHGGVIALSVALRGRAAIQALVLFDPVPIGVLTHAAGGADIIRELTAFVAEYRQAYDLGDPWAVRRVIDRLGGDGAFDAMPERAREAVKAGTEQNLRHWETNLAFRPSADQYRALRVPTTIVQGEKSRPVDRLLGKTLCDLIPDCRCIELSGASHFMINTHAAECASIVDGVFNANRTNR